MEDLPEAHPWLPGVACRLEGMVDELETVIRTRQNDEGLRTECARWWSKGTGGGGPKGEGPPRC